MYVHDCLQRSVSRSSLGIIEGRSGSTNDQGGPQNGIVLVDPARELWEAVFGIPTQSVIHPKTLRLSTTLAEYHSRSAEAQILPSTSPESVSHPS